VRNGEHGTVTTKLSKRIEVTGTVQGVGFRPFVYRLARELGVAGCVRNVAGGVQVVAEGAEPELAAFVRRLRDDAPPLARVREVRVEDAPPAALDGFRIEMTAAAGELDVDAAPDVATCDACLAEMLDPADRRHRHPFINCTDCGPRYTIIESLPYDRPNTSMRDFPMCPQCDREYHDPGDRRFHAQPVCCPECGPKLSVLDAEGRLLPVEDPIAEVASRLAAGAIAAVKGIGGFHLACDATSSEAVRRLRGRKWREEKPLAVLARDVAAARRVASISPEERALLEGPQRPIVLLAKKGEGVLAPEVDPRSRFHGLMLPYTPVHHLLTEELPYLVMTSGNRTEEPIARTNEEALEKLRGIADVFLVHDRDILTRNDDSVARWIAGDAVLLRRSRGHAPEPIAAGQDVDGVLACGPMLKNCIAVGRGELAYLSPHVGDLTNLDSYRSMARASEKLCRMLGVEPTLVACDRHPGYASTRYAKETGLPVIEVWHHHAHVAACMAEHGLHGPVIGIAWDGTGYGDDGHTWGSEILIADRRRYERLGHLAYMPMPGADAAVKHPGRMAVGALFSRMGAAAARAVPWLDDAEAEAVARMLERDVNCPLTCGMGRLFDAAAALLDVCRRTTYEGRPAIELEGVAEPRAQGTYPVQLTEANGRLLADGPGLLAALVADRDAGTPVPTIAGRFHNALARLLVRFAEAARDRTGITDVCLSGGCFQNALLLERGIAALHDAGLAVHRHRLAPPNDGCVALGQLVVAASRKE